MRRRGAIATDEADEALARRPPGGSSGLARTHRLRGACSTTGHASGGPTTRIPSGPVSADELVGTDRDHLVRQLRDFEDVGCVRDRRGWRRCRR